MIPRRLSRMFGRGGKKEAGPPQENPTVQVKESVSNETLLLERFRTMGVSLAYLLSLKVPKGADFRVVRDLILDLTRDTPGNRSLASHLEQDPGNKHHVGKANYFVSYAWSGSYEATMEALAHHFKDKLKVFFWIDIAMVDQHAAANTNVDFDGWSRTFGGTLNEIGKAVLVLTPGEKPIAITRSWCCFEWASIKKAGIPFEYCVTPADAEGLIRRMESGMGFDDFNKLFSGINVEKATAFKPSDEQAILRLMREIGVKEVNDTIMFSLKDWLLRVATEAEKRVKDGTQEGVYLLNAKASLHDALGEYDEALPLYKQALAMARQLPENDSGVALQLNNLAVLLKSRGDFSGAESLYREALAIRRRISGDAHSDTAGSLNNLAQLLSSKGDYDGAIPLQEEAVSVWKKALGNEHPQVALGLNNLARLLESKGDYSRAEPLYREAIVIFKSLLGEGHPNVATLLNNLAQLLSSKRDYAGAIPLQEEAIAIWKKVLGNDHPQVAIGLNNLAQLFKLKGDYSGAEPLFRAAIEIGEKTLGRSHPDVATWLNNLAMLLCAKGDYAGAEPLYREALAIDKKALGNVHPGVANDLNNLAVLLRDTNRKDEAREVGREAYEVALRALGDGHPNMVHYKYRLTF